MFANDPAPGLTRGIPMEALMGMLVLIAIPWFFLSLFVAWAAEEIGRNAVGWFLLALLFSPIITVLFLIAVGQKQVKRKNRKIGFRGMMPKKSAAFLIGQKAGQTVRHLGKS